MKKLLAKKFRIIFGSLIILWILIAPLLARLLVVEKPLERADAIFIFSGSSVYIERSSKAFEVFTNGVSGKIILTDDGERGGWSQTEKRNPPFVELARVELQKDGVPAENIEILQPDGSGTIYEARVLAGAIKKENLKSVLLVTSAYHSRRAYWITEKVLRENNLEITLGIVTPETGKQTPSPYFWWLFPRGWSFVAGEYVKGVYYWLYY